MNRLEMLTHYEHFNKAQKYIIGFSHKGKIYAQTVTHLDPDMITLESASKNQGESLRFRPKAAHKAEMLLKAVCLGTMEMLINEKYNKGEMFEKIITERYGLQWQKDCVPFYKAGDITVNGVEIQIKFEKAALATSNTIEKLLAIT